MARTKAKECLARRENASAIQTIGTATSVLSLLALIHQPLMASEVVRVVDGDSLIVRLNGIPQQLRLACVDAPEIGQFPYGRLAMNALNGLLPTDSDIVIYPIKKDPYGRTIGHIITPGGADIAEELVRRGLVFVYKRYLSDCDGPKLLLLESQARDSRTGVWSETNQGITRPWIYRRGSNEKTSF